MYIRTHKCILAHPHVLIAESLVTGPAWIWVLKFKSTLCNTLLIRSSISGIGLQSTKLCRAR
uniref:Uncharacterized protein n=1 Tax=Rhizophora mucronata TaxID=61149 RepID=A0A2P2NP01_RHIMU